MPLTSSSCYSKDYSPTLLNPPTSLLQHVGKPHFPWQPCKFSSFCYFSEASLLLHYALDLKILQVRFANSAKSTNKPSSAWRWAPIPCQTSKFSSFATSQKHLFCFTMPLISSLWSSKVDLSTLLTAPTSLLRPEGDLHPPWQLCTFSSIATSQKRPFCFTMSLTSSSWFSKVDSQLY